MSSEINQVSGTAAQLWTGLKGGVGEEIPWVRRREEDTHKRRRRRMVTRQRVEVVVSLKFPSWDFFGRNTGSGAQWRSMASWHARTGDLPCVCVCVYECVRSPRQLDGCFLLMWFIRVTITARCSHRPQCNWFIGLASLAVQTHGWRCCVWWCDDGLRWSTLAWWDRRSAFRAAISAGTVPFYC